MNMEQAKATVEAVAKAHPKFIPVGEARVEFGMGAVDFTHFAVSQSTITGWFAKAGATVCEYGRRMETGLMHITWKQQVDVATGEIVQPTETRLSVLETIIDTGLKTFIEVGEALAEIRTDELWKDAYASWEDYLQRRWRFGLSRARQIINGAALAREILSVTDVTIPNEAQARQINSALKPFPIEYHRAIVKLATTLSDGKLTSSVVKASGDVLIDILQTGTVDGNKALLATMQETVTDEQVERIKRQQEYIQGKAIKREYIVKPTEYQVSDKGALTIFDLPPEKVVHVSIWTEAA